MGGTKADLKVALLGVTGDWSLELGMRALAGFAWFLRFAPLAIEPRTELRGVVLVEDDEWTLGGRWLLVVDVLGKTL